MKNILKTCLLTLTLVGIVVFIANSVYSNGRKDLLSESDTSMMETEARPAAQMDQLLINNTMTYIHETYDTHLQTMTQEELPVPSELLGLGREETILTLKQWSDASIADVEADKYSAFELAALTDELVHIRESVSVNILNFTCLLKAEDGYINIYTSDGMDIYLDSCLPYAEFSDADLALLEKGVYIKTDQELFNYLQNHTS